MFATVLVVGGCTKPHDYRYIRRHSGTIFCEGVGKVVCMESDQILYSATHKEYNLITVYEFVVSKVVGGENFGSMNYENDLPLKWKNENDVLTLEIGDVDNGNFKEYEKTDGE